MPQHFNIITSLRTQVSTNRSQHNLSNFPYVLNCTSALCLQNFLHHRTLLTDNTLSQQFAITELLSQHIAYVLNCTSAICLQNFLHHRTLLTDNTLSQQFAITELLSQHIAYVLFGTSALCLQNFIYLRTLLTDSNLSQQFAIILNCISANGSHCCRTTRSGREWR